MSGGQFRSILSPDAAAQIVEQADYYRLKSGQRLAVRWRKSVQSTVRSLRSMPERESLCQFQNLQLKGVRRRAVDDFPNHILFFSVDLQTKIVRILYMLHGARDVETFFVEHLTGDNLS